MNSEEFQPSLLPQVSAKSLLGDFLIPPHVGRWVLPVQAGCRSCPGKTFRGVTQIVCLDFAGWGERMPPPGCGASVGLFLDSGAVLVRCWEEGVTWAARLSQGELFSQ